MIADAITMLTMRLLYTVLWFSEEIFVAGYNHNIRGIKYDQEDVPILKDDRFGIRGVV